MQTLLKHERQKRGWTIENVARQIGVTKQSVHKIEIGKNKPSYDVLLKICKLYKVPHEEVEQLFTVAADETNGKEIPR